MDNLIYSNGKLFEMEKINGLETILGVKFPDKYVEIMQLHNGCNVYPFKFKNKEGKYDMINNFLSLSIVDENNLLQEYMYLSEEEKIYVPFGRDAGGNLICFDYSNNKKIPFVVYIEHEEEEESDKRVVFISESFDIFLNMLSD